MKFSILLFIAACANHCLHGQIISSIIWEKNSITPYRSDLYYMAENTVRVMVEGTMCDEYEVTYYEGEIRRDKCDLIITPRYPLEEPPFTHVILKYGNKSDTLTFAVQQAPAGLIEIPGCGGHHGQCFPGKFKELIVRPSYGINFTLEKFTLKVYRCGELIYEAKNTGSQFTDNDRAAFNQLLRKDKIEIEEATILGSDKIERTVRAAWVWVIN